jgi:type VI secretion system secreted protein VgrG
MAEAPFTQDQRFLSLTTPAGKDVLLLNSFGVSERISAPYRMELDVLSRAGTNIDPRTLLGQAISFSLSYGKLDAGKRHFHGIVSEAAIGGETERFRRYRLIVVPRLWLLTLSTNFRSFQNRNVPDIVKEVLQPYNIQTRWDLHGNYTNWDFCFQYRETDFNFVSRLFEHEGIFYFFEHEAGNHTMVIADSPAAFKPSPDQPSVRYAKDIGPGGQDFVTDFEASEEIRTGGYEAWDWHFEKSPTRFTSTVDTPNAVAGSSAYKLREFPGRVTQQFNKVDSVVGVSNESEKISRVRMQAIETQNPVYRVTSFCRAFSAGQRFSLQGGHKPGDYAITRIEHSGGQHPPYLSGMESPVIYTNSMECIRHGTPYRPMETAERALVRGPQTALVTEGPDKYGRMRVQFHWGASVTSAWVRVAQRWAGPQWGTIFLPRAGHEVIIDFIDGDPDQPLITGSLYNSQNMPPYKLPDKYTQSGIKTRSMSADGKSQGNADEFNELRFDDKKGNEEIYFHAQKDFNRVVENNDDLKVGNDQTIEIQNNRTEVVKKGNEKITVQKGNREISVDMGNDTLTVKMGNHIRKINMGKSETEAMQSITLKVGANKIVVDQTGITVDAMMIKLKGQAMIETQAPMQKQTADAMMMIKGGVTMIN